jgi:hypothetical protein
MHLNLPPFAVVPTSFRFPALAALAGRAPLGGQREVALAVYLVARMVDDTLPDRGLSAQTRTERASSARTWLSTVALPNTVRPALLKAIEASAGDPAEAGATLVDVTSVTANFLDAGARSELEQLAGTLGFRGLADQR